LTTGLTGLPVVPNSREVLISLYTKIGQDCEAYTSVHGDNHFHADLKKFANYYLKVCLESKTSEEIEVALDIAHAELLIESAEQQLDIMKVAEVHKPWEDPPAEVLAEYERTFYPDFGERRHPGQDDGAIHLSDVIAEIESEKRAAATAASTATAGAKTAAPNP